MKTKKPKKITVKKLYCGFASIRDYVVKKCIEQGKGICVHYKEWQMTLTVDDLKHKFQIHNQNFRSKWGTKPYQLFDYKFKIDGSEE